mmetsp:Transcript_10006/g.22425  ORF Transcript_10006/g.22425 Transcript_10006/m.22425 type:complete len:85 (-) Transcript_10006:1730-1984(-)
MVWKWQTMVSSELPRSCSHFVHKAHDVRATVIQAPVFFAFLQKALRDLERLDLPLCAETIKNSLAQSIVQISLFFLARPAAGGS